MGDRGPEQDRPNITFGFLSGTLPRVNGVQSREPEFRWQCGELLNADLSDARTVINEAEVASMIWDERLGARAER